MPAMMVSGAVAVAISAHRRRSRRATVGITVLSLVLLYALLANVSEKPDGIAISAMLKRAPEVMASRFVTSNVSVA